MSCPTAAWAVSTVTKLSNPITSSTPGEDFSYIYLRLKIGLRTFAEFRDPVGRLAVSIQCQLEFQPVTEFGESTFEVGCRTINPAFVGCVKEYEHCHCCPLSWDDPCLVLRNLAWKMTGVNLCQPEWREASKAH